MEGRFIKYDKSLNETFQPITFLDIRFSYVDLDQPGIISLSSNGSTVELKIQDRERFKLWKKSINTYIIRESLARDYQVLGEVGKGAFGIVSLAKKNHKNLRTDSPDFAVKAMKKTSLLSSPNGLQVTAFLLIAIEFEG